MVRFADYKHLIKNGGGGGGGEQIRLSPCNKMCFENVPYNIAPSPVNGPFLILPNRLDMGVPNPRMAY